MRCYVLDENGNPKIEKDFMKWAAWMETANRVVAKDRFMSDRYGMIVVSTVFLGISHGSADIISRPDGFLFETMIFREEGELVEDDRVLPAGFWGDEMIRYGSREQAEEGHKRVIQSMTTGVAS